MYKFLALSFFVLLPAILSAFIESGFAGPPFLTDDAEPVPFKHWEVYLFSMVDDEHHQTSANVPALEFNVGALPNLQTHLVIPMAYASPSDGPRAYGLGDVEFGLEYRFIQEMGDWPQVSVSPLLEIPTGDDERGLGNGEVWGKLPVWLQKSWSHGQYTGEAAMRSILRRGRATTFLEDCS